MAPFALRRPPGRLVALLLSLPLLCSCSRAGRVLGQRQPELPLPQGFSVVFNHREGRSYQSPLTGTARRGDDLEGFLLAALGEAEREVLVAVQDLSLPRVARSLVDLHRRGVTVRVVLENTYSTPWSRQHAATLTDHGRSRLRRLSRLADRNGDGRLTIQERRQGDAVAQLLAAGVPLIDDTADGSRGSGLMHHKFLVIDRRTILTGSANLTHSGLHGDVGAPRTRGNVNHLLRIDDRGVAQVFADEFALLWGDGPGGAADSRFGLGKPSRGARRLSVNGVPVRVLFAPHPRRDRRHGLRLIAAEIRSARRQLDMALFVFSAQTITRAIAERVDGGIPIRLVADPGFATRSFSEVLDLLGIVLPDHRCRVESGNAPLPRALRGVGTPRLARGDKLHHKFAVIDERTVITGSFNWSPAAAHQNDETLLLIESPELAAHFRREMDRLWRGAELGPTDRLRRKLAAARRRCGTSVAPAG